MAAREFPKHMDATAKVGFLEGLKRREWAWPQVAGLIDMTAESQLLVDLGAAPMPVESIGKMQVQTMIEKQMEVEPKEWEIVVSLTHKAMRGDQTANLKKWCASAGDNFQKHINKLVFTYLNSGDSTTYGLCYDGQEFFDSDHADAGADYQTAQDNEGALALSVTNFNTSLVAAQAFKDDRGEYCEYVYDTIVGSPTLNQQIGQIIGNEWEYDSGDRNVNVWQGKYKGIITPHFDAAAYVLLATNETIKPMYVVMRENPHLLKVWDDNTTAEGYTRYWKFYASYDIVYGDWRLAYLGQT